jgi:methionyl-tRNA formyltransferase
MISDYIVPRTILSTPRLGAVNLHPSLLPRYRGRAPINWAIIHGEKQLGLTAHFIDEGMDSGDIIAQESFELGEAQDVGDALQILYPLYSKLTSQVLAYFRSGHVPRRCQDHSQATTFPRRGPEDGLIDWNQPVHSIQDLVRAVAFPYPGAFTTLGGSKLIIWKARPSFLPGTTGGVPGMVICQDAEGIHVQCRNGVLLLKSLEWVAEEAGAGLRPGIVLGI